MRRDFLSFLKAFLAFFALAAAFIIFSAVVCAQGNSITGYFIVSGNIENKEIAVNNTSAINTSNPQMEEAGNPVQDSDSSPNMAPFTGSVAIDDDNGQNNQEPGLIERMFGRIISFFRKLL